MSLGVNLGAALGGGEIVFLTAGVVSRSRVRRDSMVNGQGDVSSRGPVL